MDDRILQFRVGVVVVAAMIITGILIMLFEAPSLSPAHYRVSTRVPEAPGVTVNTPVRKSGILVGRVTDVALEDDGSVLVTVDINSKYRLRDDEVFRIGTESLLGDAVVDVVPGDAKVDGAEVANGAMIQGRVQGNPLQAIDVLLDIKDDVEGAVGSIKVAADEVGGLAKNFNAAFTRNEGSLESLFGQTEASLAQFETTMANIDSVIGDPELQANFKQAMANIPQITSDLQETLAKAQEIMGSIDRVALKAETNLDNISQVTGPLAERGPELASNLDESIAGLNNLLTELNTFTQSLNNSEGSVQKIINDTELYDRLNRASTNVEDLTVRLRPIVDDIRVFTSKIARDPGRLGVSGALDRRPTGLR